MKIRKTSEILLLSFVFVCVYQPIYPAPDARAEEIEQNSIAPEEAKVKKTETESDKREALQHYIANLQNNPNDNALREKIIKLALEIDPPPEIPDEAKEYISSGIAAYKVAKSADDFNAAAAEFEKATLVVPWLAEAYYNLGSSQEKAGLYTKAVENLKLYILAAPEATDVNMIETLINKMQQEIGETPALGWIGVVFPLDTANVEESGVDKGIYIDRLAPSGPAEEAGIKAGDVIIQYGGKNIDNGKEFIEAVQQTKPGSVVQVTLVRNGEQKTLEIKIGQASIESYMMGLQNNPNNNVLREQIIKLALKMDPPPAIPEDAERFMIRGAAALKDAEDISGFMDAVAEYEKATLVAPWLASAYYNLGMVQDKAGLYEQAMESLKLYLLAAPNATDAPEIKKLLYEIEYRKEKAEKEPKAGNITQFDQERLSSFEGEWRISYYGVNGVAKAGFEGDRVIINKQGSFYRTVGLDSVFDLTTFRLSGGMLTGTVAPSFDKMKENFHNTPDSVLKQAEGRVSFQCSLTLSEDGMTISAERDNCAINYTRKSDPFFGNLASVYEYASVDRVPSYYAFTLTRETDTSSRPSTSNLSYSEYPSFQRLVDYCDVLRNDGISNDDCVEQLVYLVFLKMIDEKTKPPFNVPSTIPIGFDWQSLLTKDGDELKAHYEHILETLGKEIGPVGDTYKKAQNKIQDPAKLKLLIEMIDSETWTESSSQSYYQNSFQPGSEICFIATATFGSPDNHFVRIYRKFRDLYLIKFSCGRRLIAWYYEHSPHFAELICKYLPLRLLCGIILLVCSVIVGLFVLDGPSYIIFLFLLTTLLYLTKRVRHKIIVKSFPQ